MSTTSPTASRFTSITMRIPSLSDSSRSALMPSTRFSFTSSGNLLDQARFVHLIRNFVDDNGFTAGFGVNFHFGAGADIHLAATGTVSFFNTATTVNDCRRREVRAPGMCSISPSMLMSSSSIYARQPLIDFRQVVRRNVGCHTYGDTGRTVHQQVSRIWLA